MFLLIAHFQVDPAESPGQALLDAAEPVRLLAEQPDTRMLRWGRSTEDANRLVLVAEFDTAAGYRRAQSPLEVRTGADPVAVAGRGRAPRGLSRCWRPPTATSSGSRTSRCPTRVAELPATRAVVRRGPGRWSSGVVRSH